jgi:3-deoxy-D-manno-octulosonic acid kinase
LIVDGTPGTSASEQRLRTARGAILVAATPGTSLLETAGESAFDPVYWQALGAMSPTCRGRGSAWFVRAGAQEWVLRHFSRGGFVGKFVRDTYCWAGESRVRAFAELRLTQRLRALGLPVPVPIAAAYRRHALTYRCDLITQRIDGAAPLSARLGESSLSAAVWREIGVVVARFHAAGLDHADLNAHNLMLDVLGRVSLIDFDRGRLRAPDAPAGVAWRAGNLARLQRSLRKIAPDLPPGRYDAGCWRSFMTGYDG